ncbi:RNase H family protein [Nocardia sp. NPDC003963]
MTNDGEEVVDIFTRGACWGDRGPGGWGVLLRSGQGEREVFGGDPSTTGDRMQLTAVVRGLESLMRPAVVRLWSDSEYVIAGARDRLPSRVGSSSTGGGQVVADIDLWRRLDDLLREHRVEWVRGRGSGGAVEFERVERLAVRGAGRGGGDGSDRVAAE